MTKTTITLYLIFISFNFQSQNLIPNGDFEEYSSLPVGISEFALCIGWSNCTGEATPDYFNTNPPQTPTCFFPPFSGDGLMAFAVYSDFLPGETYREYIQTKLSSNLIIGKKYQLKFALTNGPNSIGIGGSKSDHVGVSFTNNPIIQIDMKTIDIIPQIEINTLFWDTSWQEFTFDFIADNESNYITIGNFSPDSLTNTELVNPSVFCVGCAYYYIDKMELIELQSIFEMPNVFSPNNDGLNDIFKPKWASEISNYTLSIYNRWGENIFVSNEIITGWNGKKDNEYLSDGVYFWKINYVDNLNKELIVDGFVTLFK